MKDLKEALSSDRKPDITHVRSALATYVARACEYGSHESGGVYERANYLRPVSPGGYQGGPTKEDFVRARAYLRALVSHGLKVLDAMEMHQATDPYLTDVDGMKRAVFAADDDASETATRKGVGPSYLPHLAHCASSLQMAICQAVASGLLPADPGRTWVKKVEAPAVSVAVAPEPPAPASPPASPAVLVCNAVFASFSGGLRRCNKPSGHKDMHTDVNGAWDARCVGYV